MTTTSRVDHVIVVANDVEATVEFYARVLDGVVVDLEAWRAGDTDYPAVRFGDWRIHVHVRGLGATPVARARRAGALDLAVAWPGTVERAVAHLARLGIPLEAGPVTQVGALGAGRSVYVRDPDGALLELLCYGEEP